ncbi:Response regulator, sensor histidine kinase component GacS [Pseudomonas amygdali pv. eriobotryae]|uniref:Response regulator, sensor histidine kinase component GacS n=1 Tax=Pseudomonas amygdali pv. eriobotryae TaxID=129137 RepID=A0A3M3WJ28_PSEA0|nr:Response regulator, sensor histidine kinase component GacS [Pseudomonas amygdali pv. eriobotryae]
MDLAVLGVTALEISPERLRQHIWDLENLNCKVMVLCPTTEHALFQLAVHDVYTQLQAKPACTRKLQKALSELIAPRAIPRRHWSAVVEPRAAGAVRG